MVITPVAAGPSPGVEGFPIARLAVLATAHEKSSSCGSVMSGQVVPAHFAVTPNDESSEAFAEMRTQ